MKKLLALTCMTLFLAACQDQGMGGSQAANQEAETSQEVESSLVEDMTSEGSGTETHQGEASQEEGADTRPDGVRLPWTDYSAYASPNDAGYAYYIYDDPDISSEVLPLDKGSSSQVVLFTFDDAPYDLMESQALKMAQGMQEKDVNAIFFVNGMYLNSDQGREITRAIYDMGFEIGNHTTTHPDLRELSYDQQWEELAETSQLVEEITGQAPRWFRPPFGSFNMDTILICNELGMQLMNWSFGYDWMDDYQDGQALAQISLTTDYLRGGANILMHDRIWTYEALDTMIDGYREMGYHIVDPLLIETHKNSTDPLVP